MRYTIHHEEENAQAAASSLLLPVLFKSYGMAFYIMQILV